MTKAKTFFLDEQHIYTMHTRSDSTGPSSGTGWPQDSKWGALQQFSVNSKNIRWLFWGFFFLEKWGGQRVGVGEGEAPQILWARMLLDRLEFALLIHLSFLSVWLLWRCGKNSAGGETGQISSCCLLLAPPRRDSGIREALPALCAVKSSQKDYIN